MTDQEFILAQDLLIEISRKFAESEKLDEACPVMKEAKVKLYAEIEELQLQVMILKL